jgi:peptidoglycan/xylan/chitin deacetylase (PgdA/CDA1 family)
MTGLLPRRVLPVLMYHRIGSYPGGDSALWVTREDFAAQLQRIHERGFRTLSLDEAFEVWQRGSHPRHRVLITFDDAFAETLETAAPLLLELGMRAAVFAPAALLGQAARLPSWQGGQDAATEGRIVDPQGLRAWAELGFDVGSHSLSHADLTNLSRAELQRELLESKRRLEEILARPVSDFCYPYARHTATTRQEVERAGYRAAYAGEPPRRDLFALPRMMVYPHDSEARFARKLSGYYYWLAAWHQRLSGGSQAAQQ